MAKKMSKKVSKKPAAPKPAVAASKPAKVSPAGKPRSKGEVYRVISEHTGLARKDVVAVFDAMGKLIEADLSKDVPFSVPGLMRVTVIRRPATKGGMRPNPFKPGEMMEVKPKPARKVVKVRALKGLKALV